MLEDTNSLDGAHIVILQFLWILSVLKCSVIFSQNHDSQCSVVRTLCSYDKFYNFLADLEIRTFFHKIVKTLLNFCSKYHLFLSSFDSPLTIPRTTGIKLSIFWNFGTDFLQTYFISSELKSTLTLESYAFIHKIRKSYICLMHSLSKKRRGLVTGS